MIWKAIGEIFSKKKQMVKFVVENSILIERDEPREQWNGKEAKYTSSIFCQVSAIYETLALWWIILLLTHSMFRRSYQNKFIDILPTVPVGVFSKLIFLILLWFLTLWLSRSCYSRVLSSHFRLPPAAPLRCPLVLPQCSLAAPLCFLVLPHCSL